VEPDLGERLPHPRGGIDRSARDPFTLANGLEYVRAAVDRGLPVDRFGPRISFFFQRAQRSPRGDREIRAARRLWARLVQERFHPSRSQLPQLRFHAQTAGSTLDRAAAPQHIARVAIQALAAVLGGGQSLHTNPRRSALAAERGGGHGRHSGRSRSSPTKATCPSPWTGRGPPRSRS